jgi:hypothetical protein
MRTTRPAELSVQEVDVEWVGHMVFATASVVAFTLRTVFDYLSPIMSMRVRIGNMLTLRN